MAVSYHRSVGIGLERALRHWRERGALVHQDAEATETGPLTIAISRECGAGGGALATTLGERLQWPVYDRQIVDQIAEDSGVRTQLLEALDEKRPNWFSTGIASFTPEKTLSGIGYAMRLREVLLGLAGHGQCIIVGRGATQMLPASTTLRIRVIAPREYRVRRMAAQLAISESEAARWIDHVDEGRDAFVKSYFKREAAALLGYDLSIDSSRFTTSGCANIVVAALAALSEKHARLQDN